MNQIYCSNCGQLIPGNSNFCTFCGAPQHGADAGAYRVLDPIATSPKQALAQHKVSTTPPETYPRQTLGSEGFMYFLLSVISKTFFLLVLLVIGAVLMPLLFEVLLGIYAVCVVLGSLFIYNNFQFEINQKGVEIQMGVIHKTEVSVPYGSIENVNIERTLADRLIGVARVSIETSGSPKGTTTNGAQETTVRAEAYIPGLEFKKAKKIHDLLIDGSDGIFGN